MVESPSQRLNRIEAYLTWSPLPADEFDWSREPSLGLLTERQTDALADLFERIAESVHFGRSFTSALHRLPERDVRLLEVFVSKTIKGKALKRAKLLPSLSRRTA